MVGEGVKVSSSTVDGCLRCEVFKGLGATPLSRLLELFTPTGGFGNGLRPDGKPTLSRDLIDEMVSERSMTACMGDGVRDGEAGTMGGTG